MKPGRELLIVAAIAVLAMCIGCGVLGNPNPCERSNAVRNALEETTMRDCDLITDDDLAGVRSLDVGRPVLDPFSNNPNRVEYRGYDIVPGRNIHSLSRGDFAGLDYLYVLDLDDSGLHKLPPGVFDGLSKLQSLYLGNNNLEELPPDVFNGLSNLQELYLDNNPGAPFQITHPNANLRGGGWVR